MSTRPTKRVLVLTMALFGPVGGMPAAPMAHASPVVDAAVPLAAEKVNLPGGTWDYTAIEKRFKIVSVKYDDGKKQVVWVLEAKIAIPNRPIFEATFFDSDGVRLDVAPRIDFQPQFDFKPGDRVRAILPLPDKDVLDRSAKVVLKTVKTGERES